MTLAVEETVRARVGVDLELVITPASAADVVGPPRWVRAAAWGPVELVVEGILRAPGLPEISRYDHCASSGSRDSGHHGQERSALQG